MEPDFIGVGRQAHAARRGHHHYPSGGHEDRPEDCGSSSDSSAGALKDYMENMQREEECEDMGESSRQVRVGLHFSQLVVP